MLPDKYSIDHIKTLLLCAISAGFYLQLVKGRRCLLLPPEINVHTNSMSQDGVLGCCLQQANIQHSWTALRHSLLSVRGARSKTLTAATATLSTR